MTAYALLCLLMIPVVFAIIVSICMRIDKIVIYLDKNLLEERTDPDQYLYNDEPYLIPAKDAFKHVRAKTPVDGIRDRGGA